MQKTITTLKDILTPLCKRRKDVWGNENWGHIFAAWPPIAREDIEALFIPSETGTEFVEVDFSESERGKVVYLPPLKKDPDCVPILSLYFKLKEPQSIAQLRVMLVNLDENQGPDGIYGVGFRMETPERINHDGSLSINNQSIDTTMVDYKNKLTLDLKSVRFSAYEIFIRFTQTRLRFSSNRREQGRSLKTIFRLTPDDLQVGRGTRPLRLSETGTARPSGP